LFGAAEAQWRASGGARFAPDRTAYERDVADVRAQLDDSAFVAAWDTGQAMSADQMFAYALQEESRSAEADC
jgi:hypothetical protein